MPAATKALGALAKKSGVAAEELLAMDAAKLEATAKRAEITAEQISERAAAIGIDAAQLEAASNADSPQGATLALILERAKAEDAALTPATEPAAEPAESEDEVMPFEMSPAVQDEQPRAQQQRPPSPQRQIGAAPRFANDAQAPEPAPETEPPKTLSFKPDPAVLKAAQEKRKAAHARAAAARAAAEAEEDSEDEGPCPGDAISSDSEDEDPAAEPGCPAAADKAATEVAAKATKDATRPPKKAAAKKKQQKKKKKKVEADEHAEDDFEVNLHLWADKIGKTWEWRKKKQLNSEWRTIELRDDQVHTCVIQEGIKRDVKEIIEGETGQFFWQVASNAWCKDPGSLALFSKLQTSGGGVGKPVMCFNRKQFEEEYPAEVNKSLH